MSWKDRSVFVVAIIALTGLLVAAIFLAYGTGFNPLSIFPQESRMSGEI